MRVEPGVVTGPLGRLVAYAQNGLEVLRFGGLDTGEQPSPYEVVERRPMYRLRRYYATPDTEDDTRPPVLLVHPMMLSADVWDVSPSSSAVTDLYQAGLDPWVVDFGAPDKESGGLDRTLTDHVIAVSETIDLVRKHTGKDVHLAGYSQGGMFCYQAAAYRKSRDIASVITFGAPADILAGAPLGLSEEVLTKSAEFLAEHVFSRLALPSWAARLGFKLLDPVKSARSQVDFLRQLHNRDALIGRERQRRFLEGEGWVAWSGPAIVELLRQFVVHNRLMTGGFAIGERLVTLADITCPILAFVGEVDDIGQPAAVRGVGKAAPKAEVFEYAMRAGHFGLVVGSSATKTTWPAVVDWIRWREGDGPQPAGVVPLSAAAEPGTRASDVTSRLTYGFNQLADVGLGATKNIASRATQAVRTSREITAEAVHALPRLFRLGQIQGHTRVSFGKLLAEQAERAPDGECFLFDDRVHPNAAVGERIDNVVRGLVHVGIRQGDHVGVLMETRPSALVAIAALSRLGAVAVLLPPAADLSTSIRLGEVSEIIVDPQHVVTAAATGCRVLVLGGGGGDRDVTPAGTDGVDVIDMERIDPATVSLPDWYRPNPGLAKDLAFILFSRSCGHTEAKLITNHRWALSAFGTASAAALTSRDTVYCLTPLHHPSGLLTSVGGAVAGGSRIALSRGFDPELFDAEVHRYGVTVVSYTWTLLRELVAWPVPARGESHRPIRLFLGSGMPRGLWRRVLARFPGAKVLEFYASTEGDAVLANLSGAKPGAKGRPLPGSAGVRLARFDPIARKLIEDERGYAVPCGPGETGLLLANPRVGPDPTARKLRGVFAPGDTWVATDDLFVTDSDGDYWLADNVNTVIRTARGPVYGQPIADALDDLSSVDLSVAYGVAAGEHQIAVAAVTPWRSAEITGEDVTKALAELPPNQRPDVVHVVAEMPLTTWYRPNAAALRERGVPTENAWYYDATEDAYLPRA
ncbi:MAG: AMP-binding protein [Actinophytocola sp.]|nr:AMP-binding protein [Actinophytocola sp.]